MATTNGTTEPLEESEPDARASSIADCLSWGAVHDLCLPESS